MPTAASKVFPYARSGKHQAKACTGLYIVASKSTANLYRFGKGGGGSGTRGCINDRLDKHMSEKSGKQNKTDEHRPYKPFWVYVTNYDDRNDLAIAEGLLGKRLLSSFVSRGGSTFEAGDPERVRQVAETASDEIDRLIATLNP